MKRLLFISKGESSPSTRYRALQFFSRWESAGFKPLHVTATGGIRAVVTMLIQARSADIVVVLRKTFPWPVLYLLRRLSRTLVFDFDDAIFCKTDGSTSKTRMPRFKAMIGSCDHVFAGNSYLAEMAANFNPAVTIVPTAIDLSRYVPDSTKPQEFFDLVWIGSRSTRKYLTEALPYLRIAAGAVPRLRLKIIADFDIPNAGIPTLAIPWSATSEAAELASAHVGIAPMSDDAWSRGKCALKVLQYMASGLPVVSSASGANAEIIHEGKTGFLVTTPESWAERIKQLSVDPVLCEQLGQAGRQRVIKEFSIDNAFELMCERLRNY